MKKFLQFCDDETDKTMQELRQRTALEAKVQQWQAKSKRQNATIRLLRQRNKELQASRQGWKRKCMDKKQVASYPGARHGNLPPSGYHYSAGMMSMCVALYLLVGCGYRGIVRILLYFQLEWGVLAEGIPAKSSIALWVEKVGCHRYTRAEQSQEPYGLILDECMVIGQQRLMVCLAVAAHKQGSVHTAFADVRVVHMQVASSWAGQQVSEMIGQISRKQGSAPCYVVSDGASNLGKGLREGGHVRICDVSHQVALLLERHYKKAAGFAAWQTALGQCKFKGIMQAHAYLLPPKQRTIARFMNLADSVAWAGKVLSRLGELSEWERAQLGWLADHRELVVELDAVLAVSQALIGKLRAEGLSQATGQTCLGMIAAAGGDLPPALRAALAAYVQGEVAKLADEQTCWHCCSNVIESLFGHYKANLGSNPLTGISGHLLTLPLRTGGEIEDEQVRQAMESVSVSVLSQWKRDNLPESLVVRRRKTLGKR